MNVLGRTTQRLARPAARQMSAGATRQVNLMPMEAPPSPTSQSRLFVCREGVTTLSLNEGPRGSQRPLRRAGEIERVNWCTVALGWDGDSD